MVALNSEVCHYTWIFGLASAYEILNGIYAVLNYVVKIQNVGMIIYLIPYSAILMGNSRIVYLVDVVVLSRKVLARAVYP